MRRSCLALDRTCGGADAAALRAGREDPDQPQAHGVDVSETGLDELIHELVLSSLGYAPQAVHDALEGVVAGLGPMRVTGHAGMITHHRGLHDPARAQGRMERLEGSCAAHLRKEELAPLCGDESGSDVHVRGIADDDLQSIRDSEVDGAFCAAAARSG